ncbi:T9SS type A sorting domain-containing protein [Halpernia sp.]|uniref:T9SS type A sorting domain-containing protein n=1 Tax=Halpernia sp. TaxID=2782209 RepID=UPI003A947D9F
MKKIFTIFVAVAAMSVANAQLTSDNFNYTGLLTDHGWVTHSGTSGQLSANGSVANLAYGNTEDVNKGFTAVTVSPADVTIQYTATVNYTDDTGLSTFGDYFMCLGATSGASVTVLVARLYAKASATGYTLGIQNTSGGTGTPTYGTEVAYGTPSNVVVTYNALTNTATLKINSQTLLSNAAGTNAAPTTIASICLRQGSASSASTGNASIDNIVVTNASLGVNDISKVNKTLVKNTNVSNSISFSAKTDVQILNMNGQVVKTASVNENTPLNVSSLSKGIYIVTGVVDGEKVSQKIMKN